MLLLLALCFFPQDACGQFSCAPNAKRSPAPQINQAEASAELCCVLPPVERPQVELAVTASSCNAANNELLAQETRNQLVQGMSAADRALIVVEVQSCGATVRWDVFWALGGGQQRMPPGLLA